MTTRLIIARHGNTFAPGDTPTRVGARTDLPLVAKGVLQGTTLGEALKNKSLKPDHVYCSGLQRTQQTAEAALKAAGWDAKIIPNTIFDEIDYGPDENQTEEAVIARIGTQAIEDWDAKAIPPQGWQVDPNHIIENWRGFADNWLHHHEGQTALIVTSNGIARFAPYLTDDFESFAKRFSIKLSTGAFGVMEHQGNGWVVKEWNTKPEIK